MSYADSRPGYVLVGYAWSFVHPKTGQRIYAKGGRPFPIWRKA